MKRIAPVSKFVLACSAAAVAAGWASLPFAAALGQTQPSVTSTAVDGKACAKLAHARIDGGEIVSAVSVGAGSDLATGRLSFAKAKAPFCRVSAMLRPVAGSEIRVEVWLPDTWNSKLLAVGGGGFSGGLDTVAITLGTGLADGYAGLATDAGHLTVEGAGWAAGQPEKVVDWSHRANHVGARFAKALIEMHYGRPARRAYFNGCSNGGRDALMEAARYPDDYDGIIAGAPAFDWTGMNAAFLWNWQTIFQSPGAQSLPTKIATVSAAIRAKCDVRDGVKDGILENPRVCRFDPSELACKGADEKTCLTVPEVSALRKIYAGPRLRNGKAVSSGLALGDEDIPANANGWLDPTAQGTGTFGAEFFRWMVYQDPNWRAESFSLNRDYPKAVAQMGSLVDVGPDLRAFTARGGKLILWHGWSDARVPAERTVRYYGDVQRKIGGSLAKKSVRLFMAPGMAHCFAGPGPNKFDMVPELDRWVERGKAPEQVIATKFDNDLFALAGLPTKPLRTRPLCPWPKTAHYKGKGSTDDAANFACR